MLKDGQETTGRLFMTDIPQNDLADYAPVTAETRFIDFLANYAPLAPGFDSELRPRDVLVDLPSPGPPETTRTISDVRCELIGNRIGNKGVKFIRQPDLIDDTVSELLDLVNPNACVPTPFVMQVGEVRYESNYVLYYSEVSQTSNLIDELYNPVNSAIRITGTFLKSMAVARFEGNPRWRELEDRLNTGCPDVGLGWRARSTRAPGRYEIAVEDKQPSVLLPAVLRGNAPLLRLERWADQGQVLNQNLIKRRNSTSSAPVFEVVRQILETCQTRCPKLYILSCYTHYIVMRVTPPTRASPRTTIIMSRRYDRHCTNVQQDALGRTVLDPTRVNLLVIILALSVRNSEKPLPAWQAACHWPTAEEVADFGATGRSRVHRSPALHTVHEIAANSRQLRSSTRRGEATEGNRQLPTGQHLLVDVASDAQIPDFERTYPLEPYQIRRNDSFSRVDSGYGGSGSSSDGSTVRSRKSRTGPPAAAVDVNRARKALPTAVSHTGLSSSSPLHSLQDPSSSSPPARLQFLRFLAAGRIGDVYLGSYTQGSATVDVAIKVVIPKALPSELSEPVPIGDGFFLPTSEEARRRIMHEATLYEQPLAPLQGVVVPRFFGLWSGCLGSPGATPPREAEQGIEILLLVMEYLPDECPPRYEMTPSQKEVIKDLYASLAKAGVVHGDIERRHWRAGREGWRLLDFEGAKWNQHPEKGLNVKQWKKAWAREAREEAAFIEESLE